MIHLEKATRIAAPADAVWRLFATQDGQRDMERGLVASIAFEGEGVGMIRTLRMDGQPPDRCIRERVDLFDPDKREIEMTIIDTGDLIPFACHSGFARIIPAGPDASILYLRIAFMPVDIDDAEARAMGTANLDMLIANVRQALA